MLYPHARDEGDQPLSVNLDWMARRRLMRSGSKAVLLNRTQRARRAGKRPWNGSADHAGKAS
jgi:hypothetical protein